MSNIDPAALPDLLRQAVALRRQGDLAGTERLLHKVIAVDARNYDALHMLGVLAYEKGEGESAVTLIESALRIDAGQAAAHYNLGNALRLRKRHIEAIASYDRAIALNPGHGGAHNNRANCLFDLRRFNEAVAGFDRALAITPGAHEIWHNRGKALAEINLAAEAIRSFRQALALGGDAARLEYELAALGAAPAPTTAPEGFIANLFDNYAETFDHHLVAELGYSAPQATFNAVKRIAAAGDLDALDLGCGTGLCAPLLAPLSRTLTGVDLSAKMLDKARKRGLYDALFNENAGTFLAQRSAEFDLVIATDLFIYIGDLNEIFAGTARALRAGGLFAFSVEQCNDRDFVLQPSKRYAQSESYLRRLSAGHGFEVLCMEPSFIRKDGDIDIHGLVAVLRHT
jgi:predicted TPR repeat methyltransferase